MSKNITRPVKNIKKRRDTKRRRAKKLEACNKTLSESNHDCSGNAEPPEEKLISLNNDNCAEKFPMRFGRDREYELGESALTHILEGDKVVRPVSVDGVRTTQLALAGGLHTWSAWEAFLVERPEIVHLLKYDSEKHEDWFFARELQNGVITLKIPRSMFTRSAASITMQPDNYYKSGFLWKTLYPLGFSKKEVIEVLTEAFDNIDIEDSDFPTAKKNSGVLYGYALLDNPLKTLKLRIQVRGNQIQSAFPAWEQPNTGNNGKPYSHSDSISFHVADSTLHHQRYSVAWGAVFQGSSVNLQSLLELTPSFIKCRPRRDTSMPIAQWRDEREKELMSISSMIAKEDIEHIEIYLRDFVCSKDPFGVQTSLYKHFYNEICRNDLIFNAAQLLENIAECIQVVTHYDIKHGTRRAIELMIRFISMALVHTGGLCTLMFKRVLGEFIEAAQGHSDKNSLRDVLASLAISPCRSALFNEFNLNPFTKENNARGWVVIGVPEVDVDLTPEHFFEFLSLNLGESYLYHFSKSQRLAIARQSVATFELQRMVKDSMPFLSGIDFQFFMPYRLKLTALEKKLPPEEGDLIAIARDYSRMLIIYRQRIVLEDPDAYRAKLDFRVAGTDEFFSLITQKHKREFVWKVHQEMLEELKKLAINLDYDKLKVKLETMIQHLPKECIPMPKPVPADILRDRKSDKRKSVRKFNSEELAKIVLGS